MVHYEVIGDDSGYWCGKWGTAAVEEYLLDDEHFRIKSRNEDAMYDEIADNIFDNNPDWTPQQIEVETKKRMEVLVWKKAIIVYITN
jgi:hypothetical protein